MFKKRFSMMTVLVACLCAIVVTLGTVFYGMERITGDALGSLKFLKTLVLVREKFVEQPSDGKLFDGAGFIKLLTEPQCFFLIINHVVSAIFINMADHKTGRVRTDIDDCDTLHIFHSQ